MLSHAAYSHPVGGGYDAGQHISASPAGAGRALSDPSPGNLLWGQSQAPQQLHDYASTAGNSSLTAWAPETLVTTSAPMEAKSQAEAAETLALMPGIAPAAASVEAA